MRALERELGIPLFDRAGKNICLSEYGELFRPYARTIADNVALFEDSVALRKSAREHVIRIGSQYRLTNLIRRFKAEHGEYTVDDLKPDDVEQTLLDGGCDLGFVRDLDNADGPFEVRHFCTDTYVAAVSAGHALAGRDCVCVEDLREENFILHYPHNGKGSKEITLCRERGFLPHVYATVSTGSEAARLVEAGLGITFLLRDAYLANNASDVVLLPLDPPVLCEIDICWPKGRPLSAGAQLFLDFVREEEERGKTPGEDDLGAERGRPLS